MSSNGDRAEGLHINGEVYPMPVDFTFEEGKLLKKHFDGITPKQIIEGIQEDATDVGVLLPLAWVTMFRQDPTVAPDDERLMKTGIAAVFGMDDDEEVPEEGNPPTLLASRE